MWGFSSYLYVIDYYLNPTLVKEYILDGFTFWNLLELTSMVNVPQLLRKNTYSDKVDCRWYVCQLDLLLT